MSEHNRTLPPATAVSEPFWTATRNGRLMLQWCTDCERAFWFPRAGCPLCLGSALEWRQASGYGRIYTFTVEHRPQNPAFGSAPYVVALVDLDEGVRLMTNIVGCDPAQVQIGMPVEVTWHRLDDERQLPLFATRQEGLL